MAPIQTKAAASAGQSSRYGATSATLLKAHDAVSADEIPGLVASVRGTFYTERTYSKAWRVAQLKQLRKMLVKEEPALAKAMFDDLHKAPFESYATEIGLVISEIDTALASLDEWMAPIFTNNSALNFPAWSSVLHEPLGVVLVLGAWNYPLQLLLAPLVGAIAAGNCAVIKPGSYASASSNALASIIPRYMDQDCIRIVEGNRDVTTALLSTKFDKIFFTGSPFVGRIVARAAAEHLTPIVLELGGKSPCVVDKSANLEHAAERLVWASFLNAGQTCVRPDFCCVHADVADAFLAQVKKTLIRFYGEDAQKTEFFGRIINDVAFERLAALIEAEKERDADAIVTGGNCDASDRFIEPTIVDYGTDMDAFVASGLMSDELFGPLLPVYRYTNLEEVVTFIKDLVTGKPLALYAFGTNAAFIKTIKTRTTSGGLVINDALMHLANHELPFGGVGNSGMGSYHGRRSFETMSHPKAVLEKSPMLDNSILFKPLLAARFPPYTPLKQSLIRFFGAHFMETLVNQPGPALKTFVKLLVAYFVMSKLGFKIVQG